MQNRVEFISVCNHRSDHKIGSDDREASVRFINHEYDYRLNWTTQSLVTVFS